MPLIPSTELSSRLCRAHPAALVPREGANIDAKLPVLATYMGHQSLAGTQRYLHLIVELFPEITVRTNAAFGDVIPRRIES